MDRPFYIDGDEYTTRLGMVDVEELKFDIEARTDLQKCKDQTEAYKKIINDPLTLELATRILMDGAINDSLFVRKGQEKKELLVFNGCRRLAVLKHLFKNGDKRINLRKVPVQLFLNADKEFVKKILSLKLVPK
tara:strand:- start:2376 stop:2777 length:402 start_codon:yes stop_codon:yes gene_type:complete